MDIFALMQLVKQPMIDLGLSSARMLGMIAILPVFKRSELGRAILGVIALAMALPVVGGQRAALAALPIEDFWYAALLSVKEFGIGFLIGLFFGIPIWAVQAGGEIIDTQRSIAGQPHLSDPATGGPASVMSSLLGLAAIAIFVAEGGLAVAVSAIYGSYNVWPLGQFLPAALDGATLAQIGGLVGEVLLAGLLLAAPFLVFFLLSDLSAIALGRLSGRIDLSSLLPLAKNILFAVVALVYLRILVDYMSEDIQTIWQIVPRLLDLVAGP
ncbi:MAG: flagellar biosynthetic protein FliR [Pseudomonadota bacterium]